MASLTTTADAVIWTIGHSNYAIDVFLDLLRRHGIDVVADVRSSPYSAYASQFNRETLDAALGEAGIRYVFFGDQLGGRVEDERLKDEEGRVLYGRVAQLPAFQQGISRLIDSAGKFRVAILCGEEDPTDCHRRRLVGRVLQDRGLRVIHIRGDGRLQTEAELTAEETFRKTKGQRNLFDTEDPEEWKSTRSVSPKKAPPNFSGFSARPASGD